VGSLALYAHPEYLRSQVLKPPMVLTERPQLVASYAPEVEDVPQQDDWTLRQTLVE
jgi:hypothetical protein